MHLRLYLAAVCLCLFAGCGDPIARSKLNVTPSIVGSAIQPIEVVSFVRPVLETNGFKEFRDPQRSSVTFTDALNGKNPNLYITVSYEQWPVSISFMEMYSSHKTYKHKTVVKAVEAAVKEEEFDVTRE